MRCRGHTTGAVSWVPALAGHIFGAPSVNEMRMDTRHGTIRVSVRAKQAHAVSVAVTSISQYYRALQRPLEVE